MGSTLALKAGASTVAERGGFLTVRLWDTPCPSVFFVFRSGHGFFSA